MRPSSWLTAVVAATLLATWPVAGRAQGQRGPGPGAVVRGERSVELPGGGRVVRQLDRTRRLLGLAGPLVDRCGAAPARAALDRALALQQRAEDAARAGRRLGALQLTRSARQRGIEALRACGRAGEDPDVAAGALERTEELLELAREGRVRARPAARRDGTAAPIERATRLQRDAYEEFRSGRFAASLRLTLEARRTLRPGWRGGADPR